MADERERETGAETYRPRWFGDLDGMSYVPPKPGTDRYQGNCIMARDAIWQKKKLVTIIDKIPLVIELR